MKQKKQSDIATLLDYAGSHRRLTFLGLGLSAVSMVCSMVPYLCVWLATRDLIAVAPNWAQAQSVARYGWLAFGAAFGGIVLYFGGLMCTHLAAFRTAANIRKQGVAHVMNSSGDGWTRLPQTQRPCWPTIWRISWGPSSCSWPCWRCCSSLIGGWAAPACWRR